MTTMSGPRIALFGNCQTGQIARCMRVYLPHARVKTFGMPNEGNLAQIDAEIAQDGKYDYIFVQDHPAWDKLQERAVRCQRLPWLGFFGLQPDMCYISYNGKQIRTGLPEYHSAIVAGAFHVGMSAREAANLFNAYVYRQLGYFNFEPRKRSFLASCARHGYDLRQHFDKWLQRGSFMLTINHPTVWMAADVTRIALELAGIDVDGDPPVDEIAQDGLKAASVVWPVYPELARELGIKGCLLFKPPFRDSRDIITLDEFIDSSFAAYREVPREALITEQTEPVVNLLKRAA